MDVYRCLITAKNLTKSLSPGGGEKQAAETGRGLNEKRQHKEQVKQAIDGIKASNPYGCHLCRHPVHLLLCQLG